MDLSKKLIIFIAVFLVLILFLVFWYFERYQPQPAIEIMPGVKSLVYENKEFGFALDYPENSQLRTENLEGYLETDKNGIIGIFLDQTLFTGTNLSEASVIVGVDPSIEAVKKCGMISDYGEKTSGVKIIADKTFQAFEAVGVAAGNIYESKIYRTVINNNCYEIVELLHSGNIYNYDPGTIKEFDKQKFSSTLKNIVSTSRFITAASGAIGTVTLGPTCPVERIPPDPNCAPKPYQTKIDILSVDGLKIIKTINSDLDGKFKVDLNPGTYEFRPVGGNPMPRCALQTAVIRSETFTSINLSCDTGIR